MRHTVRSDVEAIVAEQAGAGRLREALGIAADLPAAPVARARCREHLAGLGHGHVPPRSPRPGIRSCAPPATSRPTSWARSSISTTPAAEPTAAIARRWPQLRGARWVPAAADGALDNVGAGCTTGGRAAIMIGTSGALRKVWTTDTAPAVPFGLWRYWLDRRRVVVGGALSNGGNLAAWMRQTLGLTGRQAARRPRRPPDPRLAQSDDAAVSRR